MATFAIFTLLIAVLFLRCLLTVVSDSLESLLDEEEDADSELDSDELELWKVMCKAPEDDFLVTALS